MERPDPGASDATHGQDIRGFERCRADSLTAEPRRELKNREFTILSLKGESRRHADIDPGHAK
eukprot:2209773-Pyramimonas_sp.AAC.1